jgi:hypothetical protein
MSHSGQLSDGSLQYSISRLDQSLIRYFWRRLHKNTTKYHVALAVMSCFLQKIHVRLLGSRHLTILMAGSAFYGLEEDVYSKLTIISDSV